jgi:hypothetical protein
MQATTADSSATVAIAAGVSAGAFVALVLIVVGVVFACRKRGKSSAVVGAGRPAEMRSDNVYQAVQIRPDVADVAYDVGELVRPPAHYASPPVDEDGYARGALEEPSDELQTQKRGIISGDTGVSTNYAQL